MILAFIVRLKKLPLDRVDQRKWAGHITRKRDNRWFK